MIAVKVKKACTINCLAIGRSGDLCQIMAAKGEETRTVNCKNIAEVIFIDWQALFM